MSGSVAAAVTEEMGRYGFGRSVVDVAVAVGHSLRDVERELVGMARRGEVQTYTAPFSGGKRFRRPVGSWPSLTRPRVG